ncbi:molybdopterin-dependent oxidoreductase [Desulfitibacter alkalitolerans]|uniref:molybdopterin-dependent oxidoreductase n=1 Tax=Desulfitibacter alkalitolerans TaxID=264641 RepID=UPI0004897DA3|nr:molybdopterin cofactor-binding domain-containing protein [Desulfitibacter alkalitolerans]
MENTISFGINGKRYDIHKPGDITLLKYLRDYQGLLGAKNGCNQGHCGTCTVIVDGKAKRACLIKLSKLDGANIETIEGLSKDGKLHPIQDAFVKEGAVQCGFCTPGMVMAAKALLDANLNPSDEEIKEALKFNICRCTGYAAIIRAVKKAAAVIYGSLKESLKTEITKTGIGESPVKKDAFAKVTGRPIFADDIYFKDMLHGKLLLSAYPFAKVNSIDAAGAFKQPGVVKVLTAMDIPGRNGFGLLNPHQPVFAQDVVRYMGDPVALILAETEEQAETALKYIKVDYEPLQGVFSPEEGMKSDAPLIHKDGNVMKHVKVRRGDVDRAFARADIIIEGTYTTPMVEHAYLEPESAVAWVEEDGTVVVMTASQGSYAFREMISSALDIAEEKVRVIYTPAGGAFGGKEEPTVQIHCALGAVYTGRPVKMTLTRQESLIMSTKRHWEKMYYRHGATRDGRVIAVEAKIIADAGAYESLSQPVVFRSAVVGAGPYDIPNVKIDSYGVYTNNPPGGAFRGFGSTQVAFGAEQQMDKIARCLDMDPFEIRKINGLKEGRATITGQVLKKDCAYLKTLEEVEKALARCKESLPKPGPGKRIGIGIASSYKNVGLGAGKRDRAGASIEIDSKGTVYLKVGATDMGQGSDTVLTQMASEVTGIPYEEFTVISNDTAQTIDGGVTTASRQTYISGHAVAGAARELRKIISDLLIDTVGLRERDYEFSNDGVILKKKGKFNANVENNFITYKGLYAMAAENKVNLKAEYIYTAPTTYSLRERADHQAKVPLEKYNIHFAYCFNTQAAIVEVDEKTGEVKVLKIIAAQDLGRAIHPQNCHCQLEGAIVMGIGYGLSEEFKLVDGKMVTDNLAKLKLPKSIHVPEMETILVEEESDGPFGAKGMGEVPINSTAPAIISAIYDATGVRVENLPASKEKILEGLKNINWGHSS